MDYKEEWDKITKNYFNITSATEIKLVIPKADKTKLIKLLSLSQIIIINGPSGRFDVALSQAETALLELGEMVPVQIEVTIAGAKTIIQIQNALNIMPSLA